MHCARGWLHAILLCALVLATWSGEEASGTALVHPNLHHHAPTLSRGRVARSRSRMDCPQAHRLLSEAFDGRGDSRVPLIPLPGRLWTLPQG